MNHPNIEVSKDVFKADHSKYYIFDDDIVIMGGVNIEDKENGKDMQNRQYQDYMIKLEGKEHVKTFLTKLETGENVSKEYSNKPVLSVLKIISPSSFKMRRYSFKLLG